MNVYIWNDTPGTITETYNITPSTTSKDTSIYKSGYKITQVIISFNAYTSGSSSQWAGVDHRVQDSSGNRFRSYLDMGYSSTVQNKSYTADVYSSSSTIETYQATNLGYANVKTKITYTLTENGITVVYGTNTYTRDFGASAKALIKSVFESNTVKYTYRLDNYGQADDYTVTVTYEQI